MKIVLLLRRLRARPDGLPAREPIGRCDDAALRAALAVRGAAPGSTITAVAAGPAAREDGALEHALAAGVDRALRVYDEQLDTVDYYGVARVLAATARQAGYDLVLVGDRSEDEGQGAVGGGVAETLGVPSLSGALDVSVEGKVVLVTRRDLLVVRTLKLPLPALVTVAAHPAPAPTAEGKGTKEKIEVIELASLGLTAAELKHRDRCIGRASPVRLSRNATLFADAAELVARLRADHLLES